jgi:hypothetical protein
MTTAAPDANNRRPKSANARTRGRWAADAAAATMGIKCAGALSSAILGPFYFFTFFLMVIEVNRRTRSYGSTRTNWFGIFFTAHGSRSTPAKRQYVDHRVVLRPLILTATTASPNLSPGPRPPGPSHPRAPRSRCAGSQQSRVASVRLGALAVV